MAETYQATIPYDQAPVAEDDVHSQEALPLNMPRPRRPSAASSFHSLASSAPSYGYTDSPGTSAENQDAYMSAARAMVGPSHDSNGFLVALPGSQTATVRWSDLVHLLLDPATTAKLPPGHLVAGLAEGVAARLEHDPGAFPLTTSPTSDHRVSYAPPSHESPARGFFQPQLFADGTGGHLVDSSIPRPHALSSFPAFAAPGMMVGTPPDALPPYSSSAYVDPSHVTTNNAASEEALLPALPTPPVYLHQTGPASSFSSGGTLTRSYPSGHGSMYGYGNGGRPPSIRSETAASISSRRSASRQSSTQSPYRRPPVIQTSHLTASSLHDYAGSSYMHASSSRSGGQDELDEPATAVPNEMSRLTIGRRTGYAANRRHLRPMNREEEIYIWSHVRHSLTRAAADRAGQIRIRAGEEVVVFPVGSYCIVFVDDTEASPCDTRNRVNEWLRGQNCVEGCAFRFEGKRPSVIRQHVTTCKARAQILRVDPLKRFCQLQLDAQTQESRIRNSAKMSLRIKAPKHEDEDYGDRSSIFSYESYESSGGGDSRRTSWYNNELAHEADTSALEGQEEDLAMTDSEVMQDVPIETADHRASWHSNSTPADSWQAAASGSSPSKAAPLLPNQTVSDRSLTATSSDSFLSFDD